MNIKETHAEMMSKFDIINRFLDENHYAKKRRTFKDLARKLKVKETEVQSELADWLYFAPRYDAKNDRVHKLAIFLTSDTRSNRTLRGLALTEKERGEIFQTSKGFDMPGIAYIKAHQHLLLTHNGEAGVRDIRNQISDAWATTARSLESLRLVKFNDIMANGMFTEENWVAYLKPVQVHGGNPQPYYTNDHVSIRHSWARYTFEKHAGISAHQKHEVICLAPKGESSEERVGRQAACMRLNDFVKSMSLFGLELVDVSNNAVIDQDTRKPKTNPRLRFISDGSAMVEMFVMFKNLGHHGKFIMN